MSDLHELAAVASPGQTVVLRMLDQISEADMANLRMRMDGMTERTGVHFVAISKDVEVASVRPDERVGRLMRAVATMNGWLHEAQTGWGAQDVRGIDDILEGKEQ
jgi:hypothetical protein